MTRRRMLAELDSVELSEWLAFDRIEPLPDPYWIGALVASTIARVNGNKCKLEDFLPALKRRVLSAAESFANAQGFFAAFRARKG